MKIRAFEERDIEGAGEMIAARHASQRSREALLPATYEDPQVCAGALEGALRDGARGAVAEDGGEVRAFLMAVPGDDVRGLHMWSDLGCHGFDRHPEPMRSLYAELAGGWVTEGRGHHYVVAPRMDAGEGWAELGFDDSAASVWLSLGFGHEQVHGIRATGAPERAAEGVRLRRAGPEDIDALDALAPLIGSAHRVAPTLAFIEQEFFDNLREGHLELLEDPSVGYWLAESDGEVLGFATMRPFAENEYSMLHPPGAVELTVAATVPEARGRGIMGALLAAGLNWARGEGYDVCVTDWRAGNLDSSRAWPRLGFRPFAYRLHRIVDPRVLC